MHLDHVWPVAADGADVATFPPAFGTGQELGGEQWGNTRRAEENGIGPTDMLFEHAVIFAILGAQDAEADFLVRDPKIRPFGSCVKFVHQTEGACRRPVYDVNMMDF